MHTIIRDNHKAVINNGFCRKFIKVQKIKIADKGRIHQLFQGVLFELYAWNADPVYRTDRAWSMIDIYREFPLTINLSQAR